VNGLLHEFGGVEGNGGTSPGGNSGVSAAIFLFTALATSSAFAPGAWKIARPADGFPSSEKT
jgi:hypothetical protein